MAEYEITHPNGQKAKLVAPDALPMRHVLTLAKKNFAPADTEGRKVKALYTISDKLKQSKGDTL